MTLHSFGKQFVYDMDTLKAMMSSMLAASLMLAASYANAAQLVRKHKHSILSEIAVVESGIVQMESNKSAAYAINSMSYEVSQLPFCLDVCPYCSDAIALAEINSNAVVAIAETQQKTANDNVAGSQCYGNDLAKSQAQAIAKYESSLSQMLACNSLALYDSSALAIAMQLKPLRLEKLAVPGIASIGYSPFMFGQSSSVFPLDNASEWTALQQSNSSQADPLHSCQLDASAIPCIFSKGLSQVAAYGDYIGVSPIGFFAFAHNEDRQLSFHNSIKSIDTFNQDASPLQFSHESIGYGYGYGYASIVSIGYSPFMFGQSSSVFPLDNANRYTTLQQSNSNQADPLHSCQLDASAIPCIFSKCLSQATAYGDYAIAGQASFSSFAYNEDQQPESHNGIRPIRTFNQDASQMTFSYESISYRSYVSIGASYANMSINTSFQNAISKAKTKNIFSISELDLMSMTRENDMSWLSIPMQCKFRALQKIENGEDPTEELRIAAMWQEREEDQTLALETNKYVVSMSAIVNMRSISAKSNVVVGFYNALDQIKVVVAATQLDGKHLEIDEDLVSLAVKRLKQKNLMTNAVKARVYSHVMQTTFTFEVVKQP